MSAEPAYDTSRLQALQDTLRDLNAAAAADGLVAGGTATGADDESDAEPETSGRTRGRRGRAAAARLIALASRGDDDDSPDVAGTSFTEAGVVRLIAHLRRRGGTEVAWPRFLARLARVLARPVPQGQHAVAGVGLERLQICYRQLLEIERFGLARFSSRRAARRGRNRTAPALIPDIGSAPTAQP